MNNREQFGSYLLLKKLTEDPLGESFRAGKIGKQGIDRVVLMRVFNGQGLDAELLWRRVQGRAAIQQSLKNPNIGDGVDMGQVRGTPFVAYDYTSGKSLAAVLEQSGRKRQPIPFDHALLISERIALALTVAYETRFGDERLLHGFLVPHLILVSNEGETRLLGFEVSPALREVATTTAAREQFARYLAPEAVAGQSPGKSDDVYSLGVILFELLTGKSLPPPTANGYGPIIDQSMLFSEGTPLPPDIGNLLKRSLAPREQRLADPANWHKALGKLMADGHFNPTTFNLAFFMHNLFREDIDRESQEIAAEKKIQVAPPVQEKPVTAPPPPPPAPRFGVREDTNVRDEPSVTSGGASAGGSKKGMLIGIAAAAALLLGGGAYVFMNRGATSNPATATIVPPAAPPPQPAAPAGPTPEQLQAQIDKIIQERLQASEATLNKKYSEQLAGLQKQLEDAKRVQPAAPSRPVYTPASTPPVTAPSTAAPVPAPALSLAPATAAPATATPAAAAPTVPTTPAAAPPIAAAPAPAPAPVVPEVHLGDQVQMGPGVVGPKKLTMPNARYPEIAKRANKTAVVTVNILVDENGRVIDVKLRDAQKAGFGFDESAVDAARRGTFSPATKNGVRVKMWTTLAINFGQQQ